MQDRQPTSSRRRFFAGAATVGAAAASVAVLPRMVASGQSVAEQAPRPAPERGGGYHESEHVRHYYKTTRI
ncbi:formate dehydrogenase [Diaphorobacter sp. J5-51]|uniref:formate dehydrogenase n=1 Tax=Diaphorobacter sp. J5-51 TaxID=680496 RepID=UPI000A043AE1|nr:formate dehydrogenase [Diaphorobacter sp. J5-51]